MSNRFGHNPLRTVVFGMPGPLLRFALPVLSQRGVSIQAIVTPGNRRMSEPLREARWPPRVDTRMNLIRPSPMIPNYLVRNADSPELIGRIQRLQPDLIVVACFPWLIPPEIYETASWLAVNLHPSLLPAHRGPDPIFWTFRNGEQTTGASIHRLSPAYDAGPILAQQVVPVPEPVTYHELELTLAERASELLDGLLKQYPNVPGSILPSATAPSWESKATSDDLLIPRDWSVEHARRFIIGVAASHGPLRYQIGGGRSVQITGLWYGTETTEIVLSNGSLTVTTAPTRQVFQAGTH